MNFNLSINFVTNVVPHSIHLNKFYDLIWLQTNNLQIQVHRANLDLHRVWHGQGARKCLGRKTHQVIQLKGQVVQLKGQMFLFLRRQQYDRIQGAATQEHSGRVRPCDEQQSSVRTTRGFVVRECSAEVK